MQPMDKNSTRFLHYCDILTNNTDLIADLWGFDQQFQQVFAGLDLVCFIPDENVVTRLISNINGK